MRHIESRLQIACLNWFRIQPRFKKIQKLLFAVPNGGKRNAFEAKIMKAEGITPGVSDLILFYSNGFNHALCIEFKTSTGKQTPLQIEWQLLAESHGHKYVVIRSLDQFIAAIETYLKGLL